MLTPSVIAHRRVRLAALTIAAVTLLISCSKRDAPLNDSSIVLTPAPPDAPATAPGTPVRGTIAAVNDTSLTVTTATGAQQIHVDAPLRVYARTSSDLAHVTPNAFVGITSVSQPDGSQRATEIHIFPEELRGTGEGSRLMEATTGGSRSTMTNGAVSRSRMTNGAVSTTSGGTSYTVEYQGGSQTIVIPANVAVTIIAPTDAKLAVGANVVVLTKVAGGRLSASGVMLAAPPK
ncbi:MAG: hypothetical protein ABIT20_21730 [Gemmatimonadaceae bacterium]